MQPDLVILDLGLLDMKGKNFFLRLREWSQAPTIVLSVIAAEIEKVLALDTGANDYVTKPFGINELMARIRVEQRSNEEILTSQTVFEEQGLPVDLAHREIYVDGVRVHLSKKEYGLLHLLIVSHGRVLTHQQILREVWGPNRQNETHHRRVLVGQLRHKLGDNPARPRCIVTVQGEWATGLLSMRHNSGKKQADMRRLLKPNGQKAWLIYASTSLALCAGLLRRSVRQACASN